MTERIGPSKARPLDGECLVRTAGWMSLFAESFDLLTGVPFSGHHPLLGRVLSPAYGAVALWVGNPDRRLMGFVVEHVDRVSAALDEMAREAQEMELR